MGPYEVVTTFDNGLVEIKTIDDAQISFLVNGHGLGLYHKVISRKKNCRMSHNRRQWNW